MTACSECVGVLIDPEPDKGTWTRNVLRTGRKIGGGYVTSYVPAQIGIWIPRSSSLLPVRFGESRTTSIFFFAAGFSMVIAFITYLIGGVK